MDFDSKNVYAIVIASYVAYSLIWLIMWYWFIIYNSSSGSSASYEVTYKFIFLY